MKIRFNVFTITCLTIHMLFIYYVITFNIIYEKSYQSWLEGCLLSIILDWFVLEIGTKVIQGGIRELCMKYPSLK